MLRNRCQIHALVIVALSAFFLPGMCNETYADTYSETHYAGTVTGITKNDDGKVIKVEWTNIFEPTVVLYDAKWFAPSNPNPLDGSTSPGDDQSREELALQNSAYSGIDVEVELPFEFTPVAKHLTSSGKGPVVVWNPSGDGDGNGPTSQNLIDLKTLMLPEHEIGGAGVGDGGIDPNGGPVVEQLKKMKGKGVDGGDGSSPPKSMNPFFGYGLLGPPELVNPIPVDQGFTLMGSFAPSGVGRTGLGNSVVPGLGNARMLGNANMLGGALNPGQMGSRAVHTGGVIPAIRAMAAPSSAQLR